MTALPAPASLDPLEFWTDGAELYRGAVVSNLANVRASIAHLPGHRAGIRLTGLDTLRPLISATGVIGSIAARVLGPASTPVRAILFDKTATINWALDWHQDRTICVRERHEVAGFGPWTIKRGLRHVAPPFELLERMVILRFHLDDVPGTNAPLLIAPGSHRAGRVPESAIGEVVRQCGVRMCLAAAGDVWLYATPILHASQTASRPIRRRVLQIDYAAEDLPAPLEWLGV